MPLDGLCWQFGAVLHSECVAGAADAAEVLAGGAGPFLEAAGPSSSYAEVFDDMSWDEIIRTRVQVGLEFVGTDVGTPIIAFDTPSGRSGGFGPILSRMHEAADGVEMWDAMIKLATHDGFWELKRSRTEDARFPARP